MLSVCFFLRIRRPPRSTRTDTLFPYTTLFRSTEVGQVDAARGDIGRNADPRAPVAKRLKGMVALALAQFTRQRDGREAALHKAGVQPPNALARGAEYHRAARRDQAQNVDDRTEARRVGKACVSQ